MDTDILTLGQFSKVIIDGLKLAPDILNEHIYSFTDQLILENNKVWNKDDSVEHCQHCSKTFTMMCRRHHCRYCGKIFCYKCSNFKIILPGEVKTTQLLKSNRKRVCSKCYFNIVEYRNLKEVISVFNKLPLTIKDYNTIFKVCKCWNKVSFNFYNTLRNIKNAMIHSKLNRGDTYILQLNNNLFYGHSKWMVRYIINYNWCGSNISYTTIKRFLTKPRTTSCKNLLCPNSCCASLELEDIILIFSSKVIYTPLIKVLIDLLKVMSLHETFTHEFERYLSFFIDVLRYYRHYTSINTLIQQFLLINCVKNINLSNKLFWLLTQNINDPKVSTYFTLFRKRLVQLIDKETYALFQRGFDFTQNIIQIVDKDGINAIINLKKYLKDHKKSTIKFHLPINLNRTIQHIDYTEIVAIDSKTRPIVFPCIYNENERYLIMLKKEDIRPEAIIMNIIHLVNLFLQREDNIDLAITTYNILPISSQYGYIEFVPNSATLYHIKEVCKFSIQNWLIENNNLPITTYRNNLCRSCAAYCIITYLLGIGDRHLDNIMITTTGKIFHIDFGYILGKEPKLLSPEIRLTPEIIDAMGGINSKYYDTFKEYCLIIFKCMRRHVEIIYILLLDLVKYTPGLNINKAYVDAHIAQRFLTSYNNADAERIIIDKINNYSAKNSYGETIIDFFHKQNKSSHSSKTHSPNQGSIKKAVSYTKLTIYNYFSNM